MRSTPASKAATTTFELEFPVTFQNTEYKKLTLRRPKVKDTQLLIDKADKDPIGAQNDFVAQLAQLPPGVIGELDLEDMSVIRSWLEGFTKHIGK